MDGLRHRDRTLIFSDIDFLAFWSPPLWFSSVKPHREVPCVRGFVKSELLLYDKQNRLSEAGP